MHINIENHEFNIRQFVDIATRWDITAIKQTSTKNQPFAILTHQVTNASLYFDEFKNQLRLEIDKSENGRAFEIDIKDRFLLSIKRYKKWHSKNESEILKLFGKPNLYSMMLDIMTSTEREINKYYTSDDIEITNLHRSKEFDANHWNEKSFGLFNFLVKNYNKKGKVKYTNIYYFLKNHSKDSIVFNFIQKDYTQFILAKYQIQLKKYTKSQYSFNETELPIMKQLEVNFLNKLK